MFNIQKMMKQAQEVQFKLQEMQEKLKEIEVSGEAAGGAVRVTMTCAGIIRSLKINPEIVHSGDTEMIEDLVITAINNTSQIKDDRIQAETKSMMAGMGLPEDTQLPPR